MELVSHEAKKYDYISDIFKGTCEINNYQFLKPRITDEKGILRSSHTKEILKNNEIHKCYYSLPVYDKHEKHIFGVLVRDAGNVYIQSEVINLAVSFLRNLGLEEISVSLNDVDKHKDLEENLDALDIVVNLDSASKNELDDYLGFDIYQGDTLVGHGGSSSKDSMTYLEVDYDSLKNLTITGGEDKKLDIIVEALDEASMSDAFLLGTNLRNCGFVTEINYDGKKGKYDADYLVSLSEEHTKRYEVTLKDLKTGEEKCVGIDDLVSELSFL